MIESIINALRAMAENEVSKEDAAKAFSEIEDNIAEAIKASGVNIKLVRNGDTIIDIEDGVDKLRKEEKPAPKPEPEPEPETPISLKDLFEYEDSSEEEPSESEPVMDDEEEYGPGEKFTEITPNIHKDEYDETYIIRESVKGNRIINESLITFDSTGPDGVTTPGISDADLVWILLYRNRNNEELREKLVDILRTL